MKYLVYASKRSEMTTEQDVDQIILTSERNNRASCISGVLLIKQEFFLQYLEGPEAEVQQLVVSLQNDERHYDVKILDQGVTEQRIFPDWDMMPIKHSIEHKDYVQRIQATPIANLRHLLVKYFIDESPVSIAYGEMPY